MIRKLNHTNLKIANQIHEVFQASYTVEARILGAKDFPPLKRRVEDLTNCNSAFYGYFQEHRIAAVIEIKTPLQYTHIQSMVVHPNFFRQGIASKLISYVLSLYESKKFIVETGADNEPAVKLYKKLNFKEVRQYNTDHGIRKVRFSLHR